MRKAKISKGANQNEFKKLDAMKAYCENTEVCQQFCLLKHFDGHEIPNKTTKHKCCDICLPLCKCDKCVESLQQQKDPNNINRHSPKKLLMLPISLFIKKR